MKKNLKHFFHLSYINEWPEMECLWRPLSDHVSMFMILIFTIINLWAGFYKWTNILFSKTHQSPRIFFRFGYFCKTYSKELIKKKKHILYTTITHTKHCKLFFVTCDNKRWQMAHMSWWFEDIVAKWELEW